MRYFPGSIPCFQPAAGLFSGAISIVEPVTINRVCYTRAGSLPALELVPSVGLGELDLESCLVVSRTNFPAPKSSL